MSIEQLPKILISFGVGSVIGGVDLLGLFLTIKYFCIGKKGKKIYVAFFASEMIRLALVLGVLLCLWYNKNVSFVWLVAGPVLFSFIKFIFAWSQIKKI